jgi:hypothetical protein
MSTLSILALDYVIAIYPLLLVIIAYVIFYLKNRITLKRKYCRIYIWPNIDYKATVGNTLASFILLSYTKFAVVTYYILIPAALYNGSGDIIAYRAYYDGSLVYFGGSHGAYAALAILVSIPLILFPVILIVLRYDKDDQNIWNSILKSFQEDFRSGCYCKYCKDCSVSKFKFSFGIHNYQWVAGKYFLLRLFFLGYFQISPGTVEVFLIEVIVCILESLFFFIFRPYKLSFYNKLDGIMFLILGLLAVFNMYQYFLTTNNYQLSTATVAVQCFLLYIPLLWITIYIVYRFKRKLQCRKPNIAASVLEGHESTSEESQERKKLLATNLPDVNSDYNTFIST